MPRPLIGLNTSVLDSCSARTGNAQILLTYLDALERAGAVPLIVPPYAEEGLARAVLPTLAGFCFIGGLDYDPRWYGGRVQRAEELMDTRRDRFDLALARLVLQETRLPVLGICGGCQLINIALGGGLVQDIPSDWGHPRTLPHARNQRPVEESAYRHPLRVLDDSLLARALRAEKNTPVAVNSFHHQAVHPDRLGRGLRAAAWSSDELVEAIEANTDAELGRGDRFVLGVQWHPERMTGEPSQRALFESFVAAANQTPAR